MVAAFNSESVDEPASSERPIMVQLPSLTRKEHCRNEVANPLENVPNLHKPKDWLLQEMKVDVLVPGRFVVCWNR
ncbi:MAG: hypothetical protein L6R41_005046 [Letrouitia leprolyta]|nr:MAG: hypothetical protein L6R41_005046 [Letrouitia leprolyta]